MNLSAETIKSRSAVMGLIISASCHRNTAYNKAKTADAVRSAAGRLEKSVTMTFTCPYRPLSFCYNYWCLDTATVPLEMTITWQ